MTNISVFTFWVALTCYVVGMVFAFLYLGYRRDGLYRIADALAWVGFVAQCISVVSRAFAAGRVPWGNMYEYSTVSALIVVGAELLFVEARHKVRTVLGFALAYASLTMAIATMYFYVGPEPLQPVLDSVWLKIHVLAMIVSSSLLILGSGVLAPLYLWKLRKERLAPLVGAEAPSPAAVAAIDGAGAPADLSTEADEPMAAPAPAPRTGILPTAERLDLLSSRAITAGFFIYTFAVIAGAIWAEGAWGRYWGWDPKETWAFITWVVFASYLHARSTVDWKGKRAAVLALVGFGALMVTYYGVNILWPGLHSYAGLPR